MQTTVAIEPSTQTPVDLKGLSDHERLYCLMAEFCDPATFRGDDNNVCLFGQVAVSLGYKPNGRVTSKEFAVETLGLRDEPIYKCIYGAATWYGDDLQGALAMARKALGIA